MISISSIVIFCYLALLYYNVNLSNISRAFFEAFCIAFIRAAYLLNLIDTCSETELFKNALKTIDATYNS